MKELMVATCKFEEAEFEGGDNKGIIYKGGKVRESKDHNKVLHIFLATSLNDFFFCVCCSGGTWG